MLSNYFKIAIRNLRRKKGYAIINIGGLAVGLAVCMIIFFIIQFQTSFDKFHPNTDRIYRVLTEYHHADNASVSYGKEVPLPLPVGLKSAFPRLEKVATVWASQNDQLLVLDEAGRPVKMFKEPRGVFFLEPSFFEIFDFPLLAGSYASLKDPDNVLLTQDIAEKYFGDWKQAIGKMINLEVGGHIFEHGTDKLKVSGILANIPANTDFQLKVVVSFGTGITGYLGQSTDWDDKTNADFGCFIVLPTGIRVADFNRQLRTYSARVKTAGNKDSHIIQALREVHHDTETGNFSNKATSYQLLNVLWLIAAFILLIACVNFINLSTAQAVNRAKEVGVRKVLGSNRAQLQIQFILETFLIVMCAVIFATLITTIVLPFVNRRLDISLSFNILVNPIILVFFVGLILIVTAIAGFYPALVLSAFSPVNALKSRVVANSAKGLSFRRALVVVQFVIAQTLIIGTFIIVDQMKYFMNQPLGFDKDAIINVPFRVDSLRISRLDYLKDKLSSIKGVKAVSFSSNTPVEDANDLWSTFKVGNAAKLADFKAITKFTDDDYVSAYNLQLVAGRNLKPSQLTREFLVNETLMRNLGIDSAKDILNKEISIWDGMIKCPVVGVLKDFNDRSFRHALAPLLLTTNVTMYSQASIKLATINTASTLQSVREIFDTTFPDFVFEYSFFDEKIEGFYKNENQFSQLYKIFSGIAILLSCLGLYGLSSFMAIQRIKEIGIRKVLGASTGSIVYLFSKEFLILIALAFFIATPIAWYYMHQWLQNYVYRISIDWWSFAGGGLASLSIALATISVQAITAARANPIESLRSD